MKILYLITKSNFGGAQRYVHDLALEAKKRGHDVVVGYGGHGVLEQKLVAGGVRTISIQELGRDVNFTADIKTFFKLLDIMRIEQPDVVHLNSSKMGAMGALAARLHNGWVWMSTFILGRGAPARIIFTGHGWAFNEERDPLQRFLIGVGHWLTIQLSHITISVSRKTREQVGALPFSWHKLTVVHNGIGSIAFRSKKRAFETLALIDPSLENSKSILHIGTLAELHKNKGLTFALEGIALLKKQVSVPIRFIVFGDGEERPALVALAEKLGITDEVRFLGYVPDAVECLFALDIFILPSITEAFPYAILEAGKAGLPIIATPVGGIPEVIDDMESGILIQSRNPSEIARALKFFIDYPEKRTEFGTKIAERIAGRFSIKAMADQTFRLYER